MVLSIQALIFSSCLSTALAAQLSAPAPKPGKMRDLIWGDINFLQTSDTHGWHAGHLQEANYQADWGDYLSFVANMRKEADKRGVDLIVVDTGDRIEGNGLSDASEPKGVYAREMFKFLDADLVTIGNHELYKAESSAAEYTDVAPFFGDRYVTSNVDVLGKDGVPVPIGKRYRKFTTKNKGYRIVAFGVLFDFERYNPTTVVRRASSMVKEEWFKKAIADKDVDMFIIYGHTPVRDAPEFDVVRNAIRAIHPDIPIQLFGGHTHIRDFAIYDKTSTGLEPGRYCESVGWLSINGMKKDGVPANLTFSRRYIDFNRYGFQYHTKTDESVFDTDLGKSVSVMLGKIRKTLDLDRVYGCAPRDYYMSRAPYPGPNSLYSLLAEEILPKLVVNPDRSDKPRYIYINTGSQRFDILKGPFTYDTSFIVSPFTSTFKYIPDVDIRVANRLMDIFNSVDKPWMLSKTRNEWASPEHRFMPSKLKAPRVMGRARQKILSEDPELTPGYVTHDDAGSDGDDTHHSPLPFYYPGNAIQANASFPLDTTTVEKVDIVFLDFIQPYILAGLSELSADYSPADTRQYMGKEWTLTRMMIEYATRYWGKECVKEEEEEDL